jgi:hypothetical protein
MTIQLPKSLEILASRADGSMSLLLRLTSILLCIGSLITGVYSLSGLLIIFPGSALLIIVPGSTIMGWDVIYLILALLHVRVVHPVTITFDLCSWLLAAAIGGLMIPGLIWLHMRCENGIPDDGCGNWAEEKRLLAASCILLFVLT